MKAPGSLPRLCARCIYDDTLNGSAFNAFVSSGQRIPDPIVVGPLIIMHNSSGMLSTFYKDIHSTFTALASSHVHVYTGRGASVWTRMMDAIVKWIVQVWDLREEMKAGNDKWKAGPDEGQKAGPTIRRRMEFWFEMTWYLKIQPRFGFELQYMIDKMQTIIKITLYWAASHAFILQKVLLRRWTRRDNDMVSTYLSAINSIMKLTKRSGDMYHSIRYNQNPVSSVWDIASDRWINKQPDGDGFTVQDRKGRREMCFTAASEPFRRWKAATEGGESAQAALLHGATGGLLLDGWVPAIDKVRPHLRQTFYILRKCWPDHWTVRSNSSQWKMDWLIEDRDSIVKAWGPGAVLLL